METLFSNCKPIFISGYTDQDKKGIVSLKTEETVACIQNPTYGIYQDQLISVFQDEDHRCGVVWYDVSENHTLIETHRAYSNESRVSCHIASHNDWVVTCNYHQHCVFVYRNGRLERELRYDSEKSHPHCALFHENKMYVCDLGMDSIYVYNTSSFELIDTLVAPESSGPRHAVMIEDVLYVLTEFSAEILKYQGSKLTSRLALTSKTTQQQGSAIRYYNGFIWAANRQTNTIYKIDLESFTMVDVIPVFGDHPRDFDLKDNLAIICNTYSNTVCIVDVENHKLIKEINIYKPSCVLLHKID